MTVSVLGVQVRDAVAGRGSDELPGYRVFQISRMLGDTLDVRRYRRALGDSLIYVIDLLLHRIYAIDRICVPLEVLHRGVCVRRYGDCFV